jgi:lysophospholipase L1-like esterase
MPIANDAPHVVVSIAANWPAAAIHGLIRRSLERSLTTTRFVIYLGQRSHIWWHTERWLMAKSQRISINPSVSNFDQGQELEYLLAHASNVRLCTKLWTVEEQARVVFINSHNIALRQGWERWIFEQAYTNSEPATKCRMWGADGYHLPLSWLARAIDLQRNLSSYCPSRFGKPMQIWPFALRDPDAGNLSRSVVNTIAQKMVREHLEAHAFSMETRVLPWAKYVVFDDSLPAIARPSLELAPMHRNSTLTHHCSAEVKSSAANCLTQGGYTDCNKLRTTGRASRHGDRSPAHVCTQQGNQQQFQVALVGDSTTSGVSLSSRSLIYPSILAGSLGSRFAVTNLGAPSATLMRATSGSAKGAPKNGPLHRPYWSLGQFRTLNESGWDAVVVMLGTNDCSRGRARISFLHCRLTTGIAAQIIVERCPLAREYANLIATIRANGKRGHKPAVYLVVPPPVVMSCNLCACEIDDQCVRGELPTIVRAVGKAAGLPSHAILDPFRAAREAYEREPQACSFAAPQPAPSFCRLFQCDRLHLSAEGSRALAAAVDLALRQHS